MKKIYEALQLFKLYDMAYDGGERRPSDLCEEMALLFTYEFKKLYDTSRSVHIFSGYGRNGACALAVARLLGEYQYKVSVYLFYNQGQLDPLCEEQRERLQALDSKVSITEVSREFRVPHFGKGEVIIDGLFGSELIRPLEPSYAALVRRINGSGLPIVSIDMPSGLYPEYNTETEYEQAVRATHTITFETPRLAMFLPENRHHIGQWHVLPLNIGEQVHAHFDSRYRQITDHALSHSLAPRERFASKASCGRAMLLGGSATRYGRLLLAAKAAMRLGCGELTVHAPLRKQSLLQLAMPELEGTGQELTEQPRSLGVYDALAIGTGLDDKPFDASYLKDLFMSCKCPIVLDGAAVDCLCYDASPFEVIPARSVLLCSQDSQVRFFGIQKHTLDTIESASELARKYAITLVLKGAYTVVCTPGGLVYFNVTGNASLATVGSGDVLTGIILGLMARGYDDVQACLLGCYLHGRAAELYTARESEESLLASDLINYLGKALKEL